MIYYLNDVRTAYKDRNNKKILDIIDNNRTAIDISINIDIAEDLFNKYKVKFEFTGVERFYQIKLMSTIINIYKHKDDILKQ